MFEVADNYQNGNHDFFYRYSGEVSVATKGQEMCCFQDHKVKTKGKCDKKNSHLI